MKPSCRNVTRTTTLISLVALTVTGFARAEPKATVTLEQQEDVPSGTIWALREQELSPISPSGQPLGPPTMLPAEYVYGSLHGAADGRRLVVAGGRPPLDTSEPSSARLLFFDTVAGTVQPITPEFEPGCVAGPQLRCELAYESPALSWDGEWIVARKFWRWVPCDGSVPTAWYPAAEAVVLRSDGSEESTLFTIVPADEPIQLRCFQNGLSFTHPRFSPDGRYVVRGFRHADTADLEIVEVATGEEQWLRVANALGADSGGCSDGSFTPDGLIVCSYFVANFLTAGVEQQWGLALFRPDGTLVRRVPGTPNRPRDERLYLAAGPVSPDGGWLLAHVGVTGPRPLVRVRVADGAVVLIEDNVEQAVWVRETVSSAPTAVMLSAVAGVRWPVTVTAVIDGDTICVLWPGPPPSDPGQTPNRKECEDHNLPGSPVRLGGIDTPELTHCYGEEATLALRRLLVGKDVWVELDPAENLDPGGRILGYLWAGDELVNYRLVFDGFAMEAHWFPSLIGLPGYQDGYVNTTKYESLLVEAQSQAQQADRGLWSACPLLREKGQTEVYWVQNKVRHHVAEAVLHLQERAGVPQWSWARIVNVPPGARDAYPQGPALVNPDSSSDGLLLRRWTREAGPTDVFLMDGGRDRHIKSQTAFAQYGFSWDDVIDVSPPVLDIPADGPTIYAIGQISVDREDFRQEFLGSYLALDAGNRQGLGFAIDWVRDEDSRSPVSARGGSSQRFDNGALQRREGDSQAFAVYGGIWLCWRGIECHLEPEPDVGSWLGWPFSNEYDWMEGRRQDFEGGYISWTAARGATPHRASPSQPNPVVSSLQTIMGSWGGTVNQPNYGRYPMTVTIGDDQVLVDYPSLRCGGSWTLSRIVGNTFVFLETLSYGSPRPCVDRVRAEVSLTNGRLRLELFHPNGERWAEATLVRQPAPSAGVTPLTGQACSQEPTLRSIDGSAATSVQFVNVSSQPVRVYWLNYMSQRVLYSELAAGAQYVQQTYVTHPWVVTDHNGLCLAIYLPLSGPGEAVVGSQQ